MKRILLFSTLAILLGSCVNNSNNEEYVSPITPLISYSLLNAYPHDTLLFTEGFLFHNGKLFESTGSPEDLPKTKSLVGISDLLTGKFNSKIELDKKLFFGEGIVFMNNKLYQLTYKNKVGFIYDEKNFKKIGEFKYSNEEGWSLTTDGQNIIMSDGSSNLTYLDPVKLSPTKILKVTENGLPRDSLNELEFIKGFIYANIWRNNSVVKINPTNGKVIGKIDLGQLMVMEQNKNSHVDVLNGIAYDTTNDKIYVTGKLWSKIYQINFNH